MSHVLTTAQLKEVNFKLRPWLHSKSTAAKRVSGFGPTRRAVEPVCQRLQLLRRRPQITQIIVAVLALLTVPKSIQAFAVIEIMFIMYYGNLDAAIFPSYTTWTYYINTAKNDPIM
ncbi:hypothetical protein B0H14DRAFT_2654568 [Mycena olivaceomarginata]|nr:hypothetical protein B0H14DRAFT_2654568 [Mycena olivaceomarginata]